MEVGVETQDPSLVCVEALSLRLDRVSCRGPLD